MSGNIDWFSKEQDVQIEAQLKSYFSKVKKTQQSFLTVSRQFGCDGHPLVQAILKRLHERGEKDWFLVDRTKLADLSAEHKITEDTLKFLESFGYSNMRSYVREALFGAPSQATTVAKIAEIMRILAMRGSVIFLEGGSQFLTKNLDNGLHVRVVAPQAWRIANHAKRWKLSENAARKAVTEEGEHRAGFVTNYLHENINDATNYCMVLNNARLGVETMADLIVGQIKPL
jgi:hypothetical protein